jgi:hypothetical protein
MPENVVEHSNTSTDPILLALERPSGGQHNFAQNFTAIIDRNIQPLFDLVEKVMEHTQPVSVKKAVGQ